MVDAIIAELRSMDVPGDAPPLRTIYLGGGTPTHLSDADLARLIGSIRDHFPIEPDAEWSIEANPEDVDVARVRGLSRQGINRMSMGVQSFDAGKLKTLQRSHDAATALRAIEMACRHLGNVSIDLIFGVPGESADVWRNDLSIAGQTAITHISTYALTFEKGTSFWTSQSKGKFSPPDELVELEMYQSAGDDLSRARFEQYEISSFARPGYRCRHNQAYWGGDGWYAAGPGAARFVGGRREVNHRSPTTYLKRIQSGQSPTVESETISAEQYARELAAFGVRQLDGIAMQTIESRTGMAIDELLRPTLDKLTHQGLVEVAGGRTRLTKRGILFADTVAAAFLG